MSEIPLIMVKKQVDLGKQIIVFIGPEGSGKSTIARRLASELQKPYISTGDIIRDLTVNDFTTPLGDECREMQKERRYLSPQMLIEILANRFKRDDTKDGFVLDGGLRTLEETENFPFLLERSERVMPLTVLYLSIPKSVSMERLVTGEDARRRDGDTVEGVLKRLSFFNNQLEERLSFIESQKTWRLLKVDASGTSDEVFNIVCQDLVSCR